MAAGTVGYTDTRGNKDYTSMIAKSIGNRLKQASNMASEERAYAAGQAEAGGTSLEEAGIGKGYFFGRALGSRFGGDRIARTRGRMGMGGAGTNPAANYKERFRGGFDYNVTNQTITDVAPLSNALVTGLRGVQEGLTDVAGAIQRQGTVLNKLSQNQADMAKATMFNGYLFAMFQSQQKQAAGRASLRREEKSIEGGSFGGRGRIGGSSFGGAGGGRGMINVTPGGARGAGGGGGAGGALSFGSSLLGGGLSILGTKQGGKLAKRFGIASGLGTTARTGIYGTDVLKAAFKVSQGLDPTKVGAKVAKLVGDPASKSVFARLLMGGKASTDAAELLGSAAGALPATKTGINQLDMMMDLQGAGMGKIGQEMADAFTRQKGLQTGSNLDSLLDYDVFRSLTDSKGRKIFNKKQAEMFRDLGLSAGEANVARYKKRLLKGKGVTNMRAAGESAEGLAEAIKRFYPNTTFKNLEDAVVLTEFARQIDMGVKPDDAVNFIRKAFGSQVADSVLIKGGKLASQNAKVAAALSKAGGKSALKKLPLIGAVLGTVFAIDRLRKGDFLGAGLEFSSGMLGMLPGLGTGLGLGIDGFLLARDMGMTPMRERGSIIPQGANIPFNIGGRMFSMNEGPKERMRIERDDDSRHVDAGLGFFEAIKKKKTDFMKFIGGGVFSGIGDAASGGLFEGIGGGIEFIVNGFKEMFSGIKERFSNFKQSLTNTLSNIKDRAGNLLNKVNPFKKDEEGKNWFQRRGDGIKNWWNKDSSDGSMIDNARFGVKKFINRAFGKNDAKNMQNYNPTEGVTYGSLPSDYAQTEAKYFQTGMYTPNVENSGINVAPAVINGATYITNNNYGTAGGGGGADTGDSNPTMDDIGVEYIAAAFNLASK